MTIEELQKFTKKSEIRNEKKVKRRLKRACSYAFRHALKAIKEAARDGKYKIEINEYNYFIRRWYCVPSGAILKFLEEHLENYGFQVEKNGYSTLVMWDK